MPGSRLLTVNDAAMLILSDAQQPRGTGRTRG